MRKEHPILMSTPMVQALLEGSKTQTRRVIKPQPDIDSKPGYVPRVLNHNENDWGKWYWETSEGETIAKDSPCGAVGDLIWVRETFSVFKDKFYFRADNNENTEWYKEVKKSHDLVGLELKDFNSTIRWRPNIFMPKPACRIWLEITAIKAERLQDISEEDITKEGVKYPVCSYCEGEYVHPVFKLGEENSALSFMPEDWQKLPEKEMTQKLLFAHWAELWCNINGRESWDANPWVWAIQFKKYKPPTQSQIIRKYERMLPNAKFHDYD